MDAPRQARPVTSFLEKLKKSVRTRSTWCPGHSRETTKIEKFVCLFLVCERIGRWFKGSGGFEILVREKEGSLVGYSETKRNVKLQGSVRKATETTHVAMYQHLRIYAEQLMKQERKMDKSGRQLRGPLSIIDDTLHI